MYGILIYNIVILNDDIFQKLEYPTKLLATNPCVKHLTVL
jgi:hypothetical protein